MEHQKILNLLDESVNPKFVTRNWNIVNDQSKGNYIVENEIIYSTEVVKCNLCDYKDAYTLLREDIIIIGHNATQVAFKNCRPLIKCITKNDRITIDWDLDLVMPMYNLSEYN